MCLCVYVYVYAYAFDVCVYDVCAFDVCVSVWLIFDSKIYFKYLEKKHKYCVERKKI
jgi:hypothetical protein